jgi:hypothetical protein
MLSYHNNARTDLTGPIREHKYLKNIKNASNNDLKVGLCEK